MPARDNEQAVTAATVAERFLWWYTEVREATLDARQFADQLPGLDAAQRRAVARLYAVERIAVCHRSLAEIDRRHAELADQYMAAHRRLQTWLVAQLVLVATLAGGLWLLCTRL
ncbi:hypothetical protein [Streptomyces sediminimaris]|uniref:hypothetical protein n=1 Tax=Streptomyces sediminimaris TaxID=3383721 RepID=UPI00399C2F7D